MVHPAEEAFPKYNAGGILRMDVFAGLRCGAITLPNPVELLRDSNEDVIKYKCSVYRNTLP